MPVSFVNVGSRSIAPAISRTFVPGFIFPGKTGITSRQRMETPVIYFYSEKERSVDVDVRFNGGRITEWYPQLTNPRAQAAPPVRDSARMQSHSGSSFGFPSLWARLAVVKAGDFSRLDRDCGGCGTGRTWKTTTRA